MKTKLVIGATVFILSACAVNQGPTQPSVAPTIPEARGVFSSWARNFKTLEGLVEASDIIVVGKINGDGTTLIPDRMVMDTEFELDVEKVLKDYKQRDKLSSLILRQTGGITQERVLEMYDDPLFKKDQRVVLFLREFEAGKVSVVGGPNGRFHVESDRIIPADKISISIEPMSEQKFVDAIDSIVKTGKKL